MMRFVWVFGIAFVCANLAWLPGEAKAAPSAEGEPLIVTNTLQIYPQDVENYLRMLYGIHSADMEWGGKVRAEQALVDIYALNLLAADARHAGTAGPVPEEWAKNYLYSMHLASLYLDAEVERRLAAIDWSEQAEEYYLVHKDELVTEEAITVRTLLLAVEDRTYLEAATLAEDLLSQAMSGVDFKDLVLEWTDDDRARQRDGLMEDVRRGQTVSAFEQAAFALEEPGALSDPVFTQFGAHLIQLVKRHPPRQLSLEEAEAGIITRLQSQQRNQILGGIRNEARDREPEGFSLNESGIKALMIEASEQGES